MSEFSSFQNYHGSVSKLTVLHILFVDIMAEYCNMLGNLSYVTYCFFEDKSHGNTDGIESILAILDCTTCWISKIIQCITEDTLAFMDTVLCAIISKVWLFAVWCYRIY